MTKVLEDYCKIYKNILKLINTISKYSKKIKKSVDDPLLHRINIDYFKLYIQLVSQLKYMVSEYEKLYEQTQKIYPKFTKKDKKSADKLFNEHETLINKISHISLIAVNIIYDIRLLFK